MYGLWNTRQAQNRFGRWETAASGEVKNPSPIPNNSPDLPREAGIKVCIGTTCSIPKPQESDLFVSSRSRDNSTIPGGNSTFSRSSDGTTCSSSSLFSSRVPSCFSRREIGKSNIAIFPEIQRLDVEKEILDDLSEWEQQETTKPPTITLSTLSTSDFTSKLDSLYEITERRFDRLEKILQSLEERMTQTVDSLSKSDLVTPVCINPVVLSQEKQWTFVPFFNEKSSATTDSWTLLKVDEHGDFVLSLYVELAGIFSGSHEIYPFGLEKVDKEFRNRDITLYFQNDSGSISGEAYGILCKKADLYVIRLEMLETNGESVKIEELELPVTFRCQVTLNGS